MLYVGLSGGIGSGKSTVSTRLAELGAVVIDADKLAREVVEPGSEGLAEVAARFGDEVLRPDGSLDRPALGGIVFADDGARRDLEAITHPRVRDLTDRRRAAVPREAIVVHDVPLLVEAGLAADHHLALIVDASEEVRSERLVRDRGMTTQEASSRIAAQATDEQRYAVADAILDNNGSREHLIEQVGTLWQERLSPYNDNLLADRGARRPLAVETADPDPSWKTAAGRSIARLRRQLEVGGLAAHVVGVDHIGPTSVDDLAAKNVIDLQVRVDDLAIADTETFRGALRAAGFVEGQRSEDARTMSFNGADPAVVHHLQVREADSGE